MHGAAECWIQVAGQTIHLRFAGRKLADALTPAIQHLESRPSERASQLVIDVWESAHAPVHMQPHEWEYASSPAHTLGPWDYVYCQPTIGMLSLQFSNHALMCFRDIAEIPPWELAIPFRTVFNSWFQRLGGQIIHGAAVGDANNAVILTGIGGAGKSSTALSCLTHPNLYYLSDDLCLLQDWHCGNPDDAKPASGASAPALLGWQGNAPDDVSRSEADPHPTVYSLYNSVKIRGGNLGVFESMDLRGLDHLPLDRGKPTFFLYPRYASKLPRQRPVRALLVPRITNQSRTRVSRATPQNAWRVLVPSTFAVVMGHRETAAKHIRRLTRGLPVFWLDLGTDRLEIADTIYEFLGNLEQQAA
jgi:hypothetical protein